MEKPEKGLRQLVGEGTVPLAEPRGDLEGVRSIVKGCLTCGGPEMTECSFTGFYTDEDGEVRMTWFCRPCVKAMVDVDADGGLLLSVTADDIMARNPELRRAYLEGRMRKTHDDPAGFVLAD